MSAAPAHIGGPTNARAAMRDRLLRPRAVPVDLGEGESAHVRALSASHLESVAALMDRASEADVGAAVEAAAMMTCLCLCDEAGDRVFEDADLDAVRAMDWPTLEAISTAALNVSGLGGGDPGN